MYFLVRAVIVFLLVLIAAVFAIKLRMHTRKWAFVLAALLLGWFLCALPVENTVVSFSTPREAYAYRYPFSGNAPCVVEGKNSALILDEASFRGTYKVLYRSSDGWKLPGIWKPLSHTTIRCDGYSIHILKQPQAEEYYVGVVPFKDNTAEVFDSENSEFCRVTYEHISEAEKCGYYAYIDCTDGYILTVNGQSRNLFP